jgi:hypothetical protein
MKKKALLVLAIVLVAGAWASRPSTGMPVGCPVCPTPTGGCYANYGTNCIPPDGFDHCSYDQARAYCLFWGQMFPTDPV